MVKLLFFNHLGKLSCSKLASSDFNVVLTQWVQSNFPHLTSILMLSRTMDIVSARRWIWRYWVLPIIGDLWKVSWSGQWQQARWQKDCEADPLDKTWLPAAQIPVWKNFNQTFFHLGLILSSFKMKDKIIYLDKLRKGMTSHNKSIEMKGT